MWKIYQPQKNMPTQEGHKCGSICMSLNFKKIHSDKLRGAIPNIFGFYFPMKRDTFERYRTAIPYIGIISATGFGEEIHRSATPAVSLTRANGSCAQASGSPLAWPWGAWSDCVCDRPRRPPRHRGPCACPMVGPLTERPSPGAVSGGGRSAPRAA